MKQKSKIRLPDFNELTKRISFVDVLSRYHLLKQMHKKGDQLRGVCPIHEGAENKNSFSVNTVKNCFNCFSCQSQGNILDFVATMENCTKVQAGRLLEQWFSIASPACGNNTSRSAGKGLRGRRVQDLSAVRQEKRGVGKVAGTVAKTGRGERLVQEKRDWVGKGSPAQEKNVNGGINPPLRLVLKNLDTKHPYLLARVKPKTIQLFGLGFCSRGLMAGRAVIPIRDESGQLVAYAGRWPSDEEIPPDGGGKYKFPPDFKKGYVLFNLHRIIEAVKVGEPLILVEGFFAVFRLYELGYHNVAALMGASLTEEQEDLLKSVLTPLSRVVLLFDNDTAGQACLRDVANRLSAWCFIKIGKLPEGIDQPDQLKERIEIF